jgi:serine protease Do
MRRAVGLDERDGLLVRAVLDDGPAAAAGVQRGDLLVAAGGAPLDGIDALYAALDGAPADAPLTLRVVRGAEELELAVTVPPAGDPA